MKHHKFAQIREQRALLHYSMSRCVESGIEAVVISVAWQALVEAVVAVEEAERALASAEPVRSCGAPSPQRFVVTPGPSCDHLIRPQQQRGRYGETEGLGGLEVEPTVDPSRGSPTGRLPSVDQGP